MHCGEHCDSDESCHVYDYSYGVLWLICCTSFIPLWNKLDTKFTRTIQLEENPSGFFRELCKSRSCKILGKQFCCWHSPDSPCIYVMPDKIVFRQIKCSYQKLVSMFKDKVQKYRQGCSYKPVKNCKQLNIAS